MGAIDRKHLEALAVHSPHPAGNVRRRSIPGYAKGILIRGKPGLPGREALDRAQLDPRLLGAPANRPEKIADDGYAHESRGDHVQPDAELEQEAATGGCRRQRIVSA